jgi:DNA-binding LacI/PurR family transcriptional regulator
MDDLRARLQRMGVKLDHYHSPRYFRPDCSKVLGELVDRNPHSGWLLLLSTRAMQSWFQVRRLPAVVSGSLYQGVHLPSLDTNFRAVGRHAGGMMFAHRHRKIALLASTLDNGTAAPGTLEIERGLRQAFTACRDPEKELTVVYHKPTSANACSCLDRLLSLPRRPTAVLVGHTTTLLTTLTHLAQRKIMIPNDMSVIVTHSEPYYAHIVPELTHYEWDPERFALEACRLFEHALNRAPIPDRCIRLMPRFIPGKTLLSVN